eukprot:snap_masked-scaffold_5-processed-gene-19.36-mRNA-1 protein AED:1.00 eAED:1.00 QI:0/-1/0/0/-1/1/1/0/393
MKSRDKCFYFSVVFIILVAVSELLYTNSLNRWSKQLIYISRFSDENSIEIVSDYRESVCFKQLPDVDVHECIKQEQLYLIKNERDEADILKNLIVFIHINKAGGTTVKKELIQKAVERRKVDGAGFGTYSGFSLLYEYLESRKNIPNRMLSHHDHHVEDPKYYSCGSEIKRENDNLDTRFPPEESCELNYLWGGLSLGLCDVFKWTPCSYFTVLRDPIARAISSYNYVCIQGSENKKKWKQEWKDMEYCPLTILEFFEQGFGNPNLMTTRLSKGVIDFKNSFYSSRSNEVMYKVAESNLFSPCLRYLLLEDLENGLNILSQDFPELLGVEAEELRRSLTKKNSALYSDRIQKQIQDPDVINKLREYAAMDIRLYESAKSMYEIQKNKTLVSCN